MSGEAQAITLVFQTVLILEFLVSFIVFDNYIFYSVEVSHEVTSVVATPGHGADREEEVSYTEVKVIGKGTFGVVYRAKLCKTGQMVAIKKVYHNEKYKVV